MMQSFRFCVWIGNRPASTGWPAALLGRNPLPFGNLEVGECDQESSWLAIFWTMPTV